MTDIRPRGFDYRYLFAKLKLEAAQFRADPTPDNFSNTLVTAWNLADWILADVTPTPAMESDLLA